MQIERTKAAILAESRKPLVVDEIELPDELGVGQVLVQVLYTSICGAQINEIAAVKGPDKFLPHLLGHEASARVLEIGPGVTTVAPGDTVVLHWRPSQGIQGVPPAYRWHGHKLNAGWVTTFNEHAVVSENRMTVIPADFDLRIAPLLGCAVTTAAGVINNDAALKIGESVAVLGVGGVGLNVVQFAAARRRPSDRRGRSGRRQARDGARARRHPLHQCDRRSTMSPPRSATIVGAKGPDKVIETTGVKSVIEMAYELTHAGRHLRAGRRAEREGVDLHAADPLQQGADRLARRRRHAARRHPPHHPARCAAGRLSLDGIDHPRVPARRDQHAPSTSCAAAAAGRVLIEMG